MSRDWVGTIGMGAILVSGIMAMSVMQAETPADALAMLEGRWAGLGYQAHTPVASKAATPDARMDIEVMEMARLCDLQDRCYPALYRDLYHLTD